MLGNRMLPRSCRCCPLLYIWCRKYSDGHSHSHKLNNHHNVPYPQSPPYHISHNTATSFQLHSGNIWVCRHGYQGYGRIQVQHRGLNRLKKLSFPVIFYLIVRQQKMIIRFQGHLLQFLKTFQVFAFLLSRVLVFASCI